MTSSIAARLIPGFGGEIFAPGTAEYDEKRVQYAFSSYPEKQGPGGSMRPYLIAYPRMDSDDIPAAIRFARANNKRIVARSGGHQYSGMSSGGDDTILLSMDLHKHLEIKAVGDKTLARVGVGTRLTDLAAAFKETRGYDAARRVSPRRDWRACAIRRIRAFAEELRPGSRSCHRVQNLHQRRDASDRASPAGTGQEQPVLGRPGRRPGEFRHSDRSYLRVHPRRGSPLLLGLSGLLCVREGPVQQGDERVQGLEREGRVRGPGLSSRCGPADFAHRRKGRRKACPCHRDDQWKQGWPE